MSGEKASALTASGTKTIFVYGPELKLLGRIESWVSLVWPERYNTYKNVQGAQLELHESTSLHGVRSPMVKRLFIEVWQKKYSRHREKEFLMRESRN